MRAPPPPPPPPPPRGGGGGGGGGRVFFSVSPAGAGGGGFVGGAEKKKQTKTKNAKKKKRDEVLPQYVFTFFLVRLELLAEMLFVSGATLLAMPGGPRGAPSPPEVVSMVSSFSVEMRKTWPSGSNFSSMRVS